MTANSNHENSKNTAKHKPKRVWQTVEAFKYKDHPPGGPGFPGALTFLTSGPPYC